MSRTFKPGDIYQPNPDNDGKMFCIPTHAKEQVEDELKKIKQANPGISDIQLDDLKNKFLHYIVEFGRMPEYDLIPPKGQSNALNTPSN